MAKEYINIPLTPEIVTLDRGHLRHSPGRSIASNSGATKSPDPRRVSTGSFRNGGRNSTGKSSSPNCGESPVPHYLRASTGSCHDFCKYGRKHEMEVKPWRTIVRRVIKPPSNMQNDAESVVLMEKKTTKASKSKLSSVLKTLSPDPSTIVENKGLSMSNEMAVSSRPGSSKETNIAMNEKKKNISEKRTPPISTGRRESEMKTDKKIGTFEAVVKKGIAPPVALRSPKPSINRVVSLKNKTYRSKKLVPPLTDQNRNKKADSKHQKVTEKTLHVIKVETEKTVLELKKKKNLNRIRQVENKLLDSEEKVSEENQPLDVEEVVENIKLSDSEKIPEKTLHVVEVDTGLIVLESMKNQRRIDSPLSEICSSTNISSPTKSPAVSFSEEEAQEELEYTDTEADESDDSISESSETLNLSETETSRGNHGSELRKAKDRNFEEEDSIPTKLEFKRGKVVDLQSNRSGPRWLRFRRGKVLRENPDNDFKTRRRSYKKREVIHVADGNDADSEKVVLRHQDVQDKKDAQGLFNNVIEETASKLVEARKSKVKALVGAFETVISLQESKPSTQSVA